MGSYTHHDIVSLLFDLSESTCLALTSLRQRLGLRFPNMYLFFVLLEPLQNISSALVDNIGGRDD